jgi:hypothetical protein
VHIGGKSAKIKSRRADASIKDVMGGIGLTGEGSSTCNF